MDEGEKDAGSSSLYLTQQLGTSAELEARLSTGGASNTLAIVRYADGLSAALESVHAEGLHHGWMTPADVVEVAGQIKLCGAGLFKSMDSKAALSLWGPASRYLAPELLSSGITSAASDWYSLAVMMLELATGTSLVSVPRGLAALAAIAPEQAQALRLALSANPAERPTSAEEFLRGVHEAWKDLAEVTMDEDVAGSSTGPPDRVDDSATIQSDSPLAMDWVKGPAVKPVKPALMRPAEPETVRVDAFVAAPNEAPTVAMGQDFVKGYIEREESAKATSGDELLVSELASPLPPGGFDDGDTVFTLKAPTPEIEESQAARRVDTPPPSAQSFIAPHEGSFDDGVTSHLPSKPLGRFDVGPTLDKEMDPPSGFEEDEDDTASLTAGPPRGFDEGETAGLTDAPPGGFDEGETAGLTDAPPAGFDEPQTAEVVLPEGGFSDGDTPTLTTESSAGDSGSTMEDMLPAGGFDEGATVVDRNPGVRLLALSMKPKPDPVKEKEKVRRPVHKGIVAKPVLRPLSSLAEKVEAPPDLGNLAPPRVVTPPPDTSRRNWLLLSLVLLAGACTAGLVLLFINSHSEEAVQTFDAGVVVAPAPDATVAPKREVIVMKPTCPEGTVHLADAKLCIDAYEAPGKGRQPQSGISLEDASSVCKKREMRLCTAEEWEASCRDAGDTNFPYGKRYKPEICNLRSSAIELAGSRDLCRSSFGIHDMSGNIAEWVAEGQIRGGSALDRSRGRCSHERPSPERQTAFSDVGFRCCADAIASPPPID